MCVISEGATIAGEDGGEGDIAKPASQRGDAGVGHRLGRAIAARLGVGVVIQELAYLMRSGEPDAMDRMVGFAFGGLAVQLLERGETGADGDALRRQLQPCADRHPAQRHASRSTSARSTTRPAIAPA